TTGRPGQTSLTAQFQELLETRRSGFLKQIGRATQALISQNCMLYKCAESVAQLHGHEWGERRTLHPISVDTLARGILREYLRTYALLDSLSRKFHFAYVCVLQPDLFTKRRRSPEEETVDEQVRDGELRSLCDTTYAAIGAAHLAHWFDLSGAFDSHPETIYSDLCHVSEEANGVIADSLIPIIRATAAPAALERQSR
ncbi:MAG TPA: hypothetical protein VEO56_08370, partial [Bacteroidota bacterium]|nr:hypothetical protein [Bacteroidota bacterium]